MPERPKPLPGNRQRPPVFFPKGGAGKGAHEKVLIRVPVAGAQRLCRIGLASFAALQSEASGERQRAKK
jgi:hypothetical protein